MSIVPSLLWMFGFLAVGIFFGFTLGREFPNRRLLRMAWQDGWRKSDGGVPPLDAEAFAREQAERELARKPS